MAFYDFDCSLLGPCSLFIETLVSINFTDQNSSDNIADRTQQLAITINCVENITKT